MLRGENVVLRATEREDLGRLWEFHNDVELEALVSARAAAPRSLAELEARFDERAADPERKDAWFVIDAGGRVIGWCGVFEFDELSRTCRVGLTIGDADFRDRGIGRECLRLLLEYAFRHRNVNKVCMDTLAENEAALRSFSAAGFVLEGRLREQYWHAGAYKDAVNMGLLRSEWEAGRATGS